MKKLILPLLIVSAILPMSGAFAFEISDFEDGAGNAAPVSLKAECVYQIPEEVKLSADFITVRRELKVEAGEKFRVKTFLKNTGNTPWFSNKSDCVGDKISLGTDRERNRKSEFYSPDIRKDDNNWESERRVGMDQERINPGEIASFTFWVEADEDPDIYKEYWTPVVNDSVWLEDAAFSYEVIIGENDEDRTTLRKKMLYAWESGSVSNINLDGEKEMLVDLSEQQVYLKLDGNVVRVLRASTGAAATPTPVGETTITLKQEVRVGGKAPHYIMPKFMWFRAGGYGFHALPSLRTDGGRFWTEAREHIGIPVSHGCVRLLPEDADFAYEFADIGTKVVVQK